MAVKVMWMLMLMLMCMQVTGTTELSPVSIACPTSSNQLQVPIKLQTITGDVQLTARLELNVSKCCTVCQRPDQFCVSFI